ncbi:hypothetical protein EDF62_3319 [Leucobacter luti]|uniref:Uncharacterized protein n=1 Tax=Leucobacter luti TaxID=340320 RepID=A0A4R6RU53_9MICO|nr:hypothetical protein [Leucobacter luti]TDP89566.1 hypothetical protein EDF62_3319 [Leucobacter luti]
MLTFAVDLERSPAETGLVVVHDEHCEHLGDAEPIGRDWRRGLDQLGGDWSTSGRKIAGCAVPGERLLSRMTQ